jgi:hypothetical protein
MGILRSLPMRIFLSPVALVAIVPALFTIPASAQSFCDLVPASAVSTALGVPNLTAKPNTTGGNGCDYRTKPGAPAAVIADSSDYTDIYKTIFDQRLARLSHGDTLLQGVGDAGYYSFQDGQNVPSDLTQSYTKQSIVFRAKGKIVSFIIFLPGKGLPKTAVLALGQMTAAKPINTLKSPN